MNFAKTEYAGTIEILASNDYQAVPIKVATPIGGDPIVKAGTPLTAEGAATTGSGAVGVLLYDVNPLKNPNAAVVVQGIIDATKAQAHSGVSYVAALYSALPGIVFRTNIGAQGATGATGETGETGATGETGET